MPAMNETTIILCQADSGIARELATLCVDLAAEANAAPPEWVQVFPASSGTLEASDGRRFKLSDAAAVIAASLAGGRDLPIDFDHATDLAAKEGRPAPACGWIKAFEIRDDGIWAQVAWNERGRTALAGLEYRYLSPVFSLTKDTREVTRILRASLTNNPAFEMTALAHAQQEKNPVDELLKALCQALGLDLEKTDRDAAIARVTELAARQGDAAVPVTELASALGIDAEGAKPESLVTAIAALKAQAAAAEPDPTKFVDLATFRATRDQLAALQSSISTERAAAAVDSAIKDGRLIPAQRDWGIAYASRDLAGFEEFVGKQPQLVGGRVAPPAGESGKPVLSETDRALCAGLGISEEKFLAQRQREQEAVR